VSVQREDCFAFRILVLDFIATQLLIAHLSFLPENFLHHGVVGRDGIPHFDTFTMAFHRVFHHTHTYNDMP